MKIEWTPAALADLAGILDHLPADMAEKTIERILHTEANMMAFPKAAIYHQDLDIFERYVPKTRVILIYHVVGEVIEIISAFHTSRHPDDKL